MREKHFLIFVCSRRILFSRGKKRVWRIFFNRVTRRHASEISFSTRVRRKASIFHPWNQVDPLCFPRKGVSSWKKRYSRGLCIRRKDLEWSNWPNSTTSRFTQVFDHATFHSIFPPFLLSSFLSFPFSFFRHKHL